tara:strand:+ start:228 stop:557 length:330 start_codon:yes stop_codon:yes gene_type:complete
MNIQANPLWFAESTAPTSESDLEWFCLNRIYLHGTIETLAGFDLIVNTTGPDTPSGIYPVVIDVSGTTYACTAHVWEINGDTIGLVALNTDRPAIDHAFAQFTAHSARI